MVVVVVDVVVVVVDGLCEVVVDGLGVVIACKKKLEIQDVKEIRKNRFASKRFIF
jgi:hypothetical protein